MDEEYYVFGCLGVVCLAIFIVVIVVGGSWRTEVTYVPSAAKVVSKQIPFEEDLKARHWAFGLIKGKQPDIQKSLSKYVRSGEEITKLTIITKHTWTDNLLAGFTLFIYCPVTVTVQGTISQASKSSP
ncbi:MAG: hypothetical protein JSU72_16725 [Deltaproteobacteria bacterium]|nr:MAG: hypothetical protein JSU72_16725 [Deltaproteobacteria bacterium]